MGRPKPKTSRAQQAAAATRRWLYRHGRGVGLGLALGTAAWVSAQDAGTTPIPSETGASTPGVPDTAPQAEQRALLERLDRVEQEAAALRAKVPGMAQEEEAQNAALERLTGQVQTLQQQTDALVAAKTDAAQSRLARTQWTGQAITSLETLDEALARGETDLGSGLAEASVSLEQSEMEAARQGAWVERDRTRSAVDSLALVNGMLESKNVQQARILIARASAAAQVANQLARSGD